MTRDAAEQFSLHALQSIEHPDLAALYPLSTAADGTIYLADGSDFNHHDEPVPFDPLTAGAVVVTRRWEYVEGNPSWGFAGPPDALFDADSLWAITVLFSQGEWAQSIWSLSRAEILTEHDPASWRGLLQLTANSIGLVHWIDSDRKAFAAAIGWAHLDQLTGGPVDAKSMTAAEFPDGRLVIENWKTSRDISIPAIAENDFIAFRSPTRKPPVLSTYFATNKHNESSTVRRKLDGGLEQIEILDSGSKSIAALLTKPMSIADAKRHASVATVATLLSSGSPINPTDVQRACDNNLDSFTRTELAQAIGEAAVDIWLKAPATPFIPGGNETVVAGHFAPGRLLEDGAPSEKPTTQFQQFTQILDAVSTSAKHLTMRVCVTDKHLDPIISSLETSTFLDEIVEHATQFAAGECVADGCLFGRGGCVCEEAD